MSLCLPWSDLNADALTRIEVETKNIGRELFAAAERNAPKIWRKAWWEDKLMAWSMRDESVKLQLFRFVDVLPRLRASTDIVAHLQQYLSLANEKAPRSLLTLLALAQGVPGGSSLAATLIRYAVSDFARKFIAGANTQEVLTAVQRERKLGRTFTLDILGEAVITEKEAEEHARAYADLIVNVANHAQHWPTQPQLDSDDSGELPKVNLSIKLSALDAKFDAIDPVGTMRRAGNRVRELFRLAMQHNVFINIDMESYEKKDLTHTLFRTILMEPEFRQWPHVGIVVQAYLHSAPHDMLSLRDWAQARGTPVWVRLVKGAYWDYETVTAQSRHWSVPVFQKKWESDAHFEALARFLLMQRQFLKPAFASHNVRSLAHVMATASHLELPVSAYELQMLYGMADAEKQALVQRQNRLRIYMPHGALIPGMAYLVRRLLENTSNNAFVRIGLLEHSAVEKLLQNPLDLAV